LKRLILGKFDPKKGELSGNQLTTLPLELLQLQQLEELNVSLNGINDIPDSIWQLANLQSLDLSVNSISDIPASIAQLVNLKSLHLRGNSISAVPASIAQLVNLQNLYLSGNEISVIPALIAQLVNLKSLDLSGNGINNIPDSIWQLVNLQSLHLGGNKISVIPASIAQLVNLQSLHLSSNQISAIPEIGQLVNLQSLDLSSNQISAIPEIGQLVNLQSLDLSSNQISAIPEIGQLVNLQSLRLGDTQISVIPASITQLANLQILDLSGNQISVIPESIGQLVNLQSLFLTRNRVSIIAASIAQLVNLEQLILSRNQISSIPEALTQLVNLQSLGLSRNQIRSIPESIGQLVNLQSLGLSRNQIRSIPESIGRLVNLQHLDLEHNQIRIIPESISQLCNLQHLDLGSNNINVIPESIAQLVNLQRLYLWNNQISLIPESINELVNLTQLALNANKISRIPESIVQLVALKRLLLQDNPITNLPPEIIRKGWGEEEYQDGDPQAIFVYLKATAKRPLNELKVLLVGEGDVGKTSLFKRLTGQSFDAAEPKTPGINIQPWHLTQADASIRLNLWDFGGQKVMHNTHQFFLTKRSLYLLVLDNRKNEAQNRVEYWLKLIETYGGDSPVIIIGNCNDENPLNLKERTLKKKYPQIKQVIATSCRTGEGIDALRQIIADQIDDIPHVRDLLPAAWFDLKAQLEAMRSDSDFISYEAYQNLCEAANITTAADQKTLIGFLHDLGVVLNYQYTDNYTWLNETNVLNPEWVTSGVYDILNNHDLMVQQKGILPLPALGNILKQPDRYPETKRPFLMGLMEKFELCFKLDDSNPTRYLISDLLPIDEPDVDVYEAAPLHFQYHYDILPSSIISRFIVRNHPMIFKSMRWRSGAILNQDTCKALVRADEEDSFIAIKVQGNRGSALLSTIRADFTKIHATIPHLAVRQFLVIRELKDDKPTGREVPVDYNYLCDLDRRGIVECPLPNLKGEYNLRHLLEGVESLEWRLADLDDRLDRSYQSRSSRPLKPLNQKPQKPGLIKITGIMLGILCVVSAILRRSRISSQQ
jgi:internalin A